MEGYLGETILDIHKTKYAMYTQYDWIMLWIEKYGTIDGEHHKNWLLDQIVQITQGTKVIIKVAEWSNGLKEFRFTLDKPTEKYHNWIKQYNDHNIGIAP